MAAPAPAAVEDGWRAYLKGGTAEDPNVQVKLFTSKANFYNINCDSQLTGARLLEVTSQNKQTFIEDYLGTQLNALSKQTLQSWFKHIQSMFTTCTLHISTANINRYQYVFVCVFITFSYCHQLYGERGSSIMVSISVCYAGCPGSSLVRSASFRKVEFCQNVINLSPPLPPTGSPKVVPCVIMSM